MKNKFNYILDHFKTIYSIDFPLEINYGLDNTSKIQIKRGDIGFFEKNDPHPQNVLWKEWNKKKIPFLFDGDDSKEIISVYDGCVVINYDIIAASFYFLSGWQEFKTDKKVPGKEFIQCRNHLFTVPRVISQIPENLAAIGFRFLLSQSVPL